MIKRMNQNYIMSFSLFNQLSNIHGFNLCNGCTYMEHITVILTDLSNDIKKKVLECKTPEEALYILEEDGIEYTHDYID